MMPEFKCAYKLAEDASTASLTFTFRNVDEALAFSEWVRSSMQNIKQLEAAANETEHWTPEEKKW